MQKADHAIFWYLRCILTLILTITGLLWYHLRLTTPAALQIIQREPLLNTVLAEYRANRLETKGVTIRVNELSRYHGLKAIPVPVVLDLYQLQKSIRVERRANATGKLGR